MYKKKYKEPFEGIELNKCETVFPVKKNVKQLWNRLKYGDTCKRCKNVLQNMACDIKYLLTYPRMVI